jgi:hypothetical protein
MPTTLPVKDVLSAGSPAFPLPVCMGPPTHLWVETIKTNKDVQDFWFGYAVGGAVCVALLILEVAGILVIFSE